jgi:RimJ/RimL family protein N-acetyltransferase
VAGYDSRPVCAGPYRFRRPAILAGMLTLRPAQPSDAYDIVRINADGWRRAYTGIVPDDVLAAIDVDQRARRHKRRMLDEQTHETLVAVDPDEPVVPDRIVGYVYFGPYRDGDRLDPGIGEVCAIYVDPPAWGTGAGRLLLTGAVDRLAAAGRTEVRLWVLADNHPARGFYAHLGFQPDGARSTFPVRRPDGRVVGLDEVRYTRTVR